MSIEDKLAATVKVLDDYSKGVGLDTIQYNSDVEIVLKLNFESLSKMSADELASSAFILDQYALFLQRQINREKAKTNWAKSNLDVVVAENGQNFDKYTKYELRIATIIKENDIARNLNQIIVKATTRLDELDFVATRIASMATKLETLHKSKKYAK